MLTDATGDAGEELSPRGDAQEREGAERPRQVPQTDMQARGLTAPDMKKLGDFPGGKEQK